MFHRFFGVISAFFVFSFLCLSCSQNVPQLNTVVASTVFDYVQDNSKPEIRLGVFVDVSSDVHRVEKIKCVCLSNNYEWECENPVKVTSGSGKNKKQYAGYSNFVMPFNSSFPMGQYVLYYTDLEGNEESLVLNVAYDDVFPKMKGNEAGAYFEQNKGSLKENWAVYDYNKLLLYYGEKGLQFSEFNEVWNRYPEAESIRQFMVLNNGRITCILPPVERRNKKTENQSEKVENENE